MRYMTVWTHGVTYSICIHEAGEGGAFGYAVLAE